MNKREIIEERKRELIKEIRFLNSTDDEYYRLKINNLLIYKIKLFQFYSNQLIEIDQKNKRL